MFVLHASYVIFDVEGFGWDAQRSSPCSPRQHGGIPAFSRAKRRIRRIRVFQFGEMAGNSKFPNS